MNDNVSSRFSLFDFLGYLIPGVLTIILFFLTREIWCGRCLSADMLLKCLMDITGKEISVGGSVLFLFFSYLVGHFVAYSSSVTVEVFSHWMHGYPSSFLLKETRRSFWGQAVEDKLYTYEVFDMAPCIVCEDCDVPVDKKEHIVFIVFKVIISLIIFPISFCSLLFGRFFGMESFYLKPLDFVTKHHIYAKLASLYNILKIDYPEKYDSDHHRLIYHYVYNKFPSHRAKFDCYVALYDFLRSIAFILNILFFVILVIAIKYSLWDSWSLFILFLLFISPYYFYMAFMKFYRRFTLESFMCLLSDPDLDSDVLIVNRD